MYNRSLLAYVVARRNAAEMDRRGIPPNLLIRLVVGTATLAGGGLILFAGFIGLLALGIVLGVIS